MPDGLQLAISTGAPPGAIQEPGTFLFAYFSHPSLQRIRRKNSLLSPLLFFQDQKRMEKISKRVNTIEEVNNNVKLLTEMVTSYSKGEMTESSEDLMKVRKDLLWWLGCTVAMAGLGEGFELHICHKPVIARECCWSISFKGWNCSSDVCFQSVAWVPLACG